MGSTACCGYPFASIKKDGGQHETNEFVLGTNQDQIDHMQILRRTIQ